MLVGTSFFPLKSARNQIIFTGQLDAPDTHSFLNKTVLLQYECPLHTSHDDEIVSLDLFLQGLVLQYGPVLHFSLLFWCPALLGGKFPVQFSVDQKVATYPGRGPDAAVGPAVDV